MQTITDYHLKKVTVGRRKLIFSRKVHKELHKSPPGMNRNHIGYFDSRVQLNFQFFSFYNFKRITKIIR